MLLPITQKPSHVSRENLETDFVNNSFSFVKEIVIMVSLILIIILISIIVF